MTAVRAGEQATIGGGTEILYLRREVPHQFRAGWNRATLPLSAMPLRLSGAVLMHSSGFASRRPISVAKLIAPLSRSLLLVVVGVDT